jgi:hypothetical protein
MQVGSGLTVPFIVDGLTDLLSREGIDPQQAQAPVGETGPRGNGVDLAFLDEDAAVHRPDRLDLLPSPVQANGRREKTASRRVPAMHRPGVLLFNFNALFEAS